MKTIQISGKLRNETGKKVTKQLRKDENVPCVIYGGESNIHFYAHKNSFRHLIYTPNAHLVNLELEDQKVNIVLKEIQFHPVSDEILHIDFVQVFDDKPVVVSIPVKPVGDSPGVKAGGRLRIKTRKLKAKGLIKDMPEVFEVNISSLQIGNTVKVGDLKYQGIELLDPHRVLVLSVAATRGIGKGELTEEEEAAEAAAAAAAAAEGTTEAAAE